MENVPKIVIERLRAKPVGPHPDADLLTAFAEQSIHGRERDEVLEHLSLCADCRDVVALALPEMEVQPVLLPHGRNWFTWPVLRWGVAVAGVALVASVGVLRYRQQSAQPSLVAKSTVYERLTAAESGNSEHSASAKASPQDRAQLPSQRETLQAAPAVQANAPSVPVNHQIVNHQIMADSNGPRAGASTQSDSVRKGISGGPEAASRAFLPQPQASSQNSADTIAGLSVPQVEAVGKAKPAQHESVVRELAPPPGLHSASGLAQGPVRWTITDNGTLRRSFDGGQVWQDIAVDQSNKSDFVASANSSAVEVAGAAPEVQKDQSADARAARSPSAPSPEKYNSALQMNTRKKMLAAIAAGAPIIRALAVASDTEVWAGGSGASLYHSVDGGDHWTRVTPGAGGVVLSGDVIRIEFSDPQHGSVTTTAPQTWITADDGLTWQKTQ